MTNQNLALNLFIERINSISDSNYGDFMRRANLYINNLYDALAGAGDTIRGRIAEMQTYTQFASDWIIESTRSRLLKDAETIRSWLVGEKQIEPVKPLHMAPLKPEYSIPWHWLHKERRA